MSTWSLLERAFASSSEAKKSVSTLTSWKAPTLGHGVDQLMLAALDLKTFSVEEIKGKFSEMDLDQDGKLSRLDVSQFFDKRMRPRLESHSPDVITKEVDRVTESFLDRFGHEKSDGIDPDAFHKVVLEQGNAVNRQVYPIAISMFLALAPIGIIIPLEPILIRELGISVQQFGMIVGSFSVTKVLLNISATDLVEARGRKAPLIASLGLLGVSVAGMGLAQSMEQLIFCRLLTGASVAGLASSIMISLTDLSTPLNRARTMSTLTTFMNAGIAIGPAAGGLLASSLGMRECFFLVGGAIIASGAVSNRIISETMLAPKRPMKGFLESYKIAISSWVDILQSSRDMQLLGLTQAMIAASQGGAQGTLLPLFLSNPPLDYSTAMVGSLFAGMAGLGVLSARPLGALSDRYGRMPAAACGLVILGVSVAGVPFAGTPAVVCGVLATWSLGQNLASPAIQALVVDSMMKSNPANVPQALSLVRTCGDMGMLLGAGSMGSLAMQYGMPFAFECSGSLTMALAAAWAFRVGLALRK